MMKLGFYYKIYKIEVADKRGKLTTIAQLKVGLGKVIPDLVNM